MTEPVTFILNDSPTSESLPPGTLVLDYLRDRRRLVGTKEGCREGDCGACVVLVGELTGDSVRYRPVTSCLMPVCELHGKHLVTIEGLRTSDLSTVQRSIVETGGSQCGFCTPGIVVSLTGSLMEATRPLDAPTVKTALGGHLCRCTGYRSLKATLSDLAATPTGVAALVRAGELPEWFSSIPSRLKALQSANGRLSVGDGALVVAGGTDLYVQKGDAVAADPDVVVLGNRPDLRGISETESHLVIGPSTTFEEMAESDAVRGVVPRIREYMDDIASLQIRNRATVGGNLVNASPIGDVTILLLALDTTLVLGGRRVPLKEFYLGYKKLDLKPGELVTSIHVRKPPEGTGVSWEKVSKRRALDIASVNSALTVRAAGATIEEATLTVGGVAPVPLRCTRTSEWLRGQPVTTDTVLQAAEEMQEEIAPISDVRGTAAYKRLLARQLLWAHFVNLFPEQISVEALYAER